MQAAATTTKELFGNLRIPQTLLKGAVHLISYQGAPIPVSCIGTDAINEYPNHTQIIIIIFFQKGHWILINISIRK